MITKIMLGDVAESIRGDVTEQTIGEGDTVKYTRSLTFTDVEGNVVTVVLTSFDEDAIKLVKHGG